ncbi:MAG: 30S ribosomal protein S17 [Gammaproteobacteria bacterium]
MNSEETGQEQASTGVTPDGEKNRRMVVGRVVSNKMNQGVSVVVERLIRHPVYGKFIRRTTKVLAHDEKNDCKEGDTVGIVECRPISKHKSWRVVTIIKSVQAS